MNGKFGASPFFALAGCDDFDDTTKRRCGHQALGGKRERSGEKGAGGMGSYGLQAFHERCFGSMGSDGFPGSAPSNMDVYTVFSGAKSPTTRFANTSVRG